jgi:hypothetical protein
MKPFIESRLIELYSILVSLESELEKYNSGVARRIFNNKIIDLVMVININKAIMCRLNGGE